MRKLIWITCLAIFPLHLLLAQSPSFTLPAHTGFPFRWQGDSVQAKWEPHAAMLIPVRLPHCPHTFYMQFDLGSPGSILYRNKLAAIRSRYPSAVPPADSDSLSDVALWIGEVPVCANALSIRQFDSTTLDWNDTLEVIGTLGADLIDGHVAIIDYPRQRLSISAAIPDSFRLNPATFTYAHKRILLPAKVNGRETLLFFDTGSSMFELLTNKESALQMARSGAQPTRFSVNSWGRQLTANTLSAAGNILIAGVPLSIRTVTFMDGADPAQVAFMTKMGIGGMVGNKLFLGYILVLDTRRRQFGLVPN